LGDIKQLLSTTSIILNNVINSQVICQGQITYANTDENKFGDIGRQLSGTPKLAVSGKVNSGQSPSEITRNAVHPKLESVIDRHQTISTADDGQTINNTARIRSFIVII
jgi:hypothetical protein